jgi:hypothetical protein
MLDDVRNIFSSKQIEEYDYLFLSSMEHSENGTIQRFIDEVGVNPKTKYGILGMYHTNWLIDEFKDYKMLEERRLFCISDFQSKGYHNLNSLSPIFFTDVIDINHIKSDNIRLLTIGNSADYELLNEAYWKLNKYERKKIHIKHIGGVPNRPDSLKGYVYLGVVRILSIFILKYRRCKNIEYVGRLDFPHMYTEIQNSDFLLVLLDDRNESHRRYIKESTSGVRQLILGFLKIGIMNQTIAENYNFNEGTYIGYKSGNLVDSLRRAININQKEYSNMVSELKRNSEKIYGIHKSNLKKTISEIENKYEYMGN